MTTLIKAIRPGEPVPDNARFVIEDEQQSPTNPIYLFRNGLWLITPLAWLLFALNLLSPSNSSSFSKSWIRNLPSLKIDPNSPASRYGLNHSWI